MAKYDKTIPNQYDGLIRQAADANGVSYDLLRHLTFNESSFNANAKSKTGPKGIMQMTAATGRAMGLNVFEEDNPADDRYNPEKAIPAAAKLLAGLVKKSNGDELRAALMYNVGEGKTGMPQIEAYDKQDYGSIGDEGRLYMRKLVGSAKSTRSEAIEKFGDFTKGLFEVEAPASKVQRGATAPETASVNMDTSNLKYDQLNERSAANKWAVANDKPEESYKPKGEDKWLFYKTGDVAKVGIQNSAVATMFDAATIGDDKGYDMWQATITPSKWNSYQFTPEDLDKIRNSGLRAEYAQSVLGSNAETIDDMIKFAKERQDRADSVADAGMGAHLVGGIAGAALDPVSYIPIAGVASKGISIGRRMAVAGTQVAALSVGSEALRVGVGGGHADYTMAAAAGLFFGAGLTGVLHRANPREAESVLAATARAESRDAAMRGLPDNSVIDTTGLNFTTSRSGAQYAVQENGDVVLPDGQVLSASNPLNPHTASQFAEVDPSDTKGALGVRMGAMTDIALHLSRSTDDEVRGVAYDLIRSTTGYAKGGSGKPSTVAGDVNESLHYMDNSDLTAIEQFTRDAIKDPEWTMGANLGTDFAREAVVRRAVEATEDGIDVAKLTSGEKKLGEAIFKFTTSKEEAMANPAMFGNPKAIPVMNKTKLSGKYFPVAYVPEKVAAFRNMFGNSVEDAQGAMQQHFLADYASNPNTKSVVDELVAAKNGLDSPAAVTPEMVEKWANDKAFGIVNGEFTTNLALDDITSVSNSMNLGKNNFLESRHGFSMAFKSQLPDGSLFSLNDLRSFDARKLLRNYARRTNGDISIHATGQTTQDLLDKITAIRNRAKGDTSGKLKQDANALEDTVKLLTGRARRDPNGAVDMAMGVLKDLSFVAKNAYMGLLNLTETGLMLAKGNVRALFHGIPVVRDMMRSTKAISGTDLQKLEYGLMGREVDNTIRPQRADLIQALRDNSGMGSFGANTLGSLKYGTQELAAAWPMSKLLQGTTNYLISAARQGLIGNLIEHAATGKSSRWLNENFLKSASITPEQAKGITQFLKDHAKVDSNGKWTFPDPHAMRMDPRAMDLWRMADKVADETMVRPNKLNAQNLRQLGPIVSAAMQFKTFVIKSLNGKTLRTFYMATKDGRSVDAALATGLSGMLSASFYVMQSHMKAAGLPENQREDYLYKALTPGMIAYAAASRSSITGAPFGITDMLLGPTGLTPSQYMRTTISPKESPEYGKNKAATGRSGTSELFGAVGQQFPVANYSGSLVSLGQNLFSLSGANGPRDYAEYTTGVYQNMKEVLPNDPLTQRLLLGAFEEHIYTTERPKRSERW